MTHVTELRRHPAAYILALCSIWLKYYLLLPATRNPQIRQISELIDLTDNNVINFQGIFHLSVLLFLVLVSSAAQQLFRFHVQTAIFFFLIKSVLIFCNFLLGTRKQSPDSDLYIFSLTYHSVQFSRSVKSDSLQTHELQHIRPPCPSPTPGVYPNLCPLSR